MKRNPSILAKDSPKHILRPAKQNKAFLLLRDLHIRSPVP